MPYKRLVLAALAGLVLSACDNPLADVYHGQTTPGPERTVKTHPVLGTNGDIVFWNGQYVMFYRATRCFKNNVPDDCSSGADLRWGIRRAVSADGGVTFNDSPSGAAGWVINPSGLATVPKGCGGAAEPGVFIDAQGKLALVYEAEPRVNGQNCEPNPENSNSYVAIARSSDGGVSWSNFDKLIYWLTNANGANVGTPEMQIVPGEGRIAVSYHVNPGLAGPGNPLTRRVHLWAYSNNLDTFNDQPPLEGHEIRIQWPNGQSLTQPYGFLHFSGGPGKADIVKAPGSDGFYMAVEAFGGVPLCNHPQMTGVYTLYARSTDIRGPYVISEHRPILIDTPRANNYCNEDMPTWWYKPTDGTFHVVLHEDHGNNVQSLSAFEMRHQPG